MCCIWGMLHLVVIQMCRMIAGPSNSATPILSPIGILVTTLSRWEVLSEGIHRGKSC